MSLFSHYEQCKRCAANGRDSRGDNLAVYKDTSVHCFSCGYHRNPPNAHRWSPVTSIKEINDVPKSLLPSDFSREIPSNAWKWLLQFGLPFSYWQEIVGYSEAYQRLVFRIGDPLAFSIGRYFGEKGYRKWHVWGDSHKHCEIIGKRSDRIVLVEDIISAHKVGQVNAAIPIFGTSVHPVYLYHLLYSNERPILWLDKDQEDSVRKQAIRLETILGKPVQVITTDKDPKELTFEEINVRIRND